MTLLAFLKFSTLQVKRNTQIDFEINGFAIVKDRKTFDKVPLLREQLTRVKESTEIPMMLVGNKADKTSERQVPKEEGSNVAKRMKCDFIETSAKTGANVE
ncbi:Ras GTPase ras2, partial [Nowakowskiella sp. JEL0078]